MEPLYKSLFICAALPINDEADLDSDTGQGHQSVWCISEKLFMRPSSCISVEKQADIGLTAAKYIDVSPW